MFNKFNKTTNSNPESNSKPLITQSENKPLLQSQESINSPASIIKTPVQSPTDIASSQHNQTRNTTMMDIISSNSNKPSILSEGFSFRGEISAKGAIHVEGSLNGQVQVDELTIGTKGQVEGVVTCSSLHIKGKFSGTATCSELIVTSSAAVDGHVVYQTLSVQKGASIKGELLLVK
jgi:cytoskeletal protein CcmA (bactofilin family)